MGFFSRFLGAGNSSGHDPERFLRPKKEKKPYTGDGRTSREIADPPRGNVVYRNADGNKVKRNPKKGK